MSVVCRLPHGYWYCKNFNEEYMIDTYQSGHSRINNKHHVVEICIHDKNEEYFPKGLTSYFPHLKILTISYCGLKTITRDQLKGLENLETLAVTSNLLKSLPDDLFTDMVKLKSVSFENNKLDSMSSKLLEPILKNKPILIDFRGNSKIDAAYLTTDDWKKLGGISINQLMDLIDANCDQPADEPREPVATIESFKDDFTAGFANLWGSGGLSDFTIIANDNKKFRVHKAVLAIQSSVFAAMFKSNMKEKRTRKIIINDFSAEAVEQFLACLYTGEIKDVSYAMEIFALAAKYNVPKLRMASEQNILHSIDQSNAFDVFALGHLHSSSVLQRYSFDAIKKSLPGIELDEGLFDDPQKMKMLIDAHEMRKRKMQEAEDEFTSICKQCA